MSKLSWSNIIEQQKKQNYFKELLLFVEAERAQGKTIYPLQENVFSAFEYTSFPEVKVVILGQDPYHGPNQAHGLAFSVLPNVKIPPSLMNMYKELAHDIDGFEIPQHGYLATDHIISTINEQHDGVIFLLWGAHAQKKGQSINKDKHHVLTAPHPSPLSAHRGFFGCRHFSQVNQILRSENKSIIQWQSSSKDETLSLRR
ncbi:MAG: uracil-DNA glycosylase [Vibrio casei]